jgi:hypothetical protein
LGGKKAFCNGGRVRQLRVNRALGRFWIASDNRLSD